jgi:hypothetical protein
MKITIYVFLLLIFGCKPNHQNKTNSSANSYLFDSIDITLFSSGSKKFPVFTGEANVIKLSKSDILKSEDILRDCINRYNTKQLREADSLNRYLREVKHKSIQVNKDDLLIRIKDYGRQYLAVQDKKGHKIIYLNCFCNPAEFKSRKSDWVLVDDGGKCFFHVKIDLTDKVIIEFSVNGVA